MITRRKFIKTAAWAGLCTGLQGILPAWARDIGHKGAPEPLSAVNDVFNLAVGRRQLTINEEIANPITVNNTLPGPLLRFREGETITLRVTNHLDEDTSVHWHGILLPADMDGVPGLSFPGIKPGETFTYRYTLEQNGTYWYHGHSGLQEQAGLMGPIIIDPQENDPISFDREFVIMLSDWTFENPDDVFAKLKKSSDYYNYQKRTVMDFLQDMSEDGVSSAIDKSMMWGRMRMDPTDIADVTGAAYTYLFNGKAPDANWTGIFQPGEKIRLRFINAAAMTYFNVRIPGLKMTVVQADGQNVRPVPVDEFQISVAETYDVIVQPDEDTAYTIFAESMDRSGYTRGTLAPRPGMAAHVPALRKKPLRSMADMGMAHGDMAGMDHTMSRHDNHTELPKKPASPGGLYLDDAGVAMTAPGAKSQLTEPGTGLRKAGHKVLVYSDLHSLTPFYDQRPPSRELEIHLTGNMERYMWSFDGKKYNEAPEPILFHHGERLRLTMINDTMMDHPIHLHGMWMVLENHAGTHAPLKHTINVKPGEKISALVSADAPGEWAFHCHLLMHMKAGMFRAVIVSDQVAEITP